MILIINNKSKFIKEFEKYLEEKKISYKEINNSDEIDFDELSDVKGVILSGGSGTPYTPLNLSANFVALANFKVPIMGICLGHEIIAAAFKGKIKPLPYQNKMEEVIIDPKYPIFRGLRKRKIQIRKKHYNHVTTLPKDFKILGHSDVCPIEIIRHKRKKIYGFQGHPEVSGEDGLKIMRNFLKICKEI